MIDSIKQWAGVVALVILAIVLLTTHTTKLGAIDSATTYGILGTTQLKVGTGCDSGFLFSTCTATSGLSITSGGLLQTDSGQLKSYTNSTSTLTTAYTFVLGDINAFDSVLITPNIAALTVTLPASSTVPTWLPAAGDRQDTCFVNSTTTAAATLTFAGATGTLLRTASSTTGIGAPNSLVIPANSGACLTFVRGPATATQFDIYAFLTRYAL